MLLRAIRLLRPAPRAPGGVRSRTGGCARDGASDMRQDAMCIDVHLVKVPQDLIDVLKEGGPLRHAHHAARDEILDERNDSFKL